MTIRAFCPTCLRTAYVGDNDDAVCPVCASPLATEPEEPPHNQDHSETA